MTRRSRYSGCVPRFVEKERRPPLRHQGIRSGGNLRVFDCERFVDKAPAQVWATLLDEGIYHCSIRTMYRILSEHGEVRERRNQLHPNYQKPELVAEAPNQVWSHNEAARPGQVDLLLPLRDSRHLLPVRDRVDVGSARKRRARPSSHQRELPQAEHRSRPAHHPRRPRQLDAKQVRRLAPLGITKTHSRPYVSNDNLYSESQFKTMKYCPEFPSSFGCLEDGRLFCGGFFDLQQRAPALGGCVPRFVEKERRPPLRHQGIRSGGNLRVFENLAQTLVAVDAS